MAMRKITIAKEASRQLEALYEIAKDSGSFGYHAYSANNYMAAIVAAGQPLPEKIIRNRGFLCTQGWRAA